MIYKVFSISKVTFFSKFGISNRNNRWVSQLVGKVVTLTSLSLMTMLGSTAFAQTLDQAISNQLGSFCAGLKGGAPQSQVLPQLGTELANLCFDPTGSGGTSSPSLSGGAAGSSQTGNAFVKRFRKLRENDKSADKGGSGEAETSTTLVEGLSVYFSGQGEGLNRKTTEFGDGYNSALWGVTAGADYRFAPWMVGGIALNFNQWKGDFKSAGGFQTDSYGPTVYASIYPADRFFADVSFRYAAKSFERNRFASYTDLGLSKQASGTTTSDSGGDELETGAVFGYDLPIKNFTIGPRVAVNYRNLVMNGYTEQGNSGLELRYLKDSVDSLQTAVGLQVSAAFSTSFGVLVPQLTGDWTHEFELNQRSVAVQFAQDFRPLPTTFSYQTDRPDRDFFHVGAGVVAVLPKGFQSYANFEALLGHSYLDDYVGTVGMRLGF